MPEVAVVSEAEQRLLLVRSALRNLRGPVGVAAARALLGVRDLDVREARIRLEAERIVLEEAVQVKGRGGKPMKLPAAQAAAMAADTPPANAAFEQLHPRGGAKNAGQFVKKGEQGPRVQAMQHRLGELGHGIVADGDFGPKTQAEVKAFQKRYGLPQTGFVDPTTLEFMRNPPALTYAQSNAELRQALAVSSGPVGLGDVGPAVEKLQQMLLGMGYDVGQDPQSTFGQGTAAVVREIQRRNGFAPTGRADEQTLALIARLSEEQARMSAAGNLAGDQLGTWGLKKPNVGEPKPKPRKTPDPNSDPNLVLRVQHPKRGGGKNVREASYDGNPTVDGSPASMARIPWGGVPGGLVQVTADILRLRPPNLREHEGFESCASCVFYGGGSTGCERWGNYPVDRDDLCDSWKTLTPEGARGDGESLDDGDEAMQEAFAGMAFPWEERKHPRGFHGKFARSLHTVTPEQGRAIQAHVAHAGALAATGRDAQGNSHPDPQGRARRHIAAAREIHRDATVAVVAAHDAEARRRGRKTIGHHISESLADLEEVKSSAYPGLDRSPKENWVDKAGGLPSYIERIAKHIHYENGRPIGTAIAMAVSTVKRWCSGGSVSKGGAHASSVSGSTKAKACAAVAEWERKKAGAKGKSLSEAARAELTFEEAAADFDVAYSLYEADFKPIPASLAWCETILGRVEEAYDWTGWNEDGTPPAVAETAELIVWAPDDVRVVAEHAKPDPQLPPLYRQVGGHHVLFVAGVPVRLLESASEGVVLEAAAQTFDARMRRMGAKQPHRRAAEKLTTGFSKHGAVRARRRHARADAAVAAATSKKFAGKGAAPRSLAYDVGTRGLQEGDASPDFGAGDGESLLLEGVVGVPSKWDEAKHPRVKTRRGGGRFAKKIGAGLEHVTELDPATASFVDRVNAPTSKTHPVGGGGGDALAVDKAIGNVLQSFPGLTDWSVDKQGDHFVVAVTMPDGKHTLRIDDAGNVEHVDGPGKKAQLAAKPEPAAPKPASFHLTGEEEKPYHMQDGQVFQSKGGKWLKKHQSGKFTSEKGHTMAGMEIEDLATGEKKWVPAFAMKEHLPLASTEPAPPKPETDKKALFDDLAASVGLHSQTLDSLSGKNVVVTGKIPGYQRSEVEAMVKAKGGTVQSSVSASTHVLIAGDKVGATKTNAAKKHGVHVVAWNDVHHLLEAGLSPRVLRALRVQLEEAASHADRAGLEASLAVLEQRMDADERAAYVELRPARAPFAVPRTENARRLVRA